MIKEAIRDVLRKRGFDLVRGPDIRTFLDVHHVDLVVDVGANEGQFARNLRQRGYKGQIWSFEPISSVFDSLQSYAQADKQWQTSRTAVGAEPGEATINVSRHTVFSSIKNLTDAATAFDPNSGIERVEVVPVATLDNLLASSPATSVFLKVDTQGFEREVLQGATRTLARVAGMQLELPVEIFYHGTWTFIEALTYLDALGFVPGQFRMVNPMRSDPSSGAEFDCIFRRK